ncbi:MAG: ferritin-like domain-containing protein [Chloroflexota bacterium]|nr:ferritin-like domain-containing protein [Chloroflexota bacterium]
MAHQELLTAWLKDAHSMENALIPILENHAKDAEGHPQMQQRIQQHIETTRRHADMVEGCLQRYGEEPSAVKTAFGSLFGNVQSIATGPFEDELVKNGISDYAAEHFEIASYRGLIAAAEEVGDQETVRVCQQILQDEMAMASWLEQHLPGAVKEAMRKKASEHTS